MTPPTLSAREVICWIDVVIGHPMTYTAERLGLSLSAVGWARCRLARKLGYTSVDVATLVRAAYAVIRDRERLPQNRGGLVNASSIDIPRFNRLRTV